MPADVKRIARRIAYASQEYGMGWASSPLASAVIFAEFLL